MNTKYLNRIGLTGIDDFTDIHRLIDLYQKYPFIEYGVCFNTLDTNEIRYAGYRLLKKIKQTPILPWVAHCSEKNSEGIFNAILECKIPNFLTDIPWQRIQINCEDILLKRILCQDFFYEMELWLKKLGYPCNIIIPEKASTRDYFQNILISNFIHILNDESGGRGIQSILNTRPLPYHNKFGYAGGISELNINLTLKFLDLLISKLPVHFESILTKTEIRTRSQIQNRTHSKTQADSKRQLKCKFPVNSLYWLDMESSLRTDKDIFSIEFAEKILEIININ